MTGSICPFRTPAPFYTKLSGSNLPHSSSLLSLPLSLSSCLHSILLFLICLTFFFILVHFKIRERRRFTSTIATSVSTSNLTEDEDKACVIVNPIILSLFSSSSCSSFSWLVINEIKSSAGAIRGGGCSVLGAAAIGTPEGRGENRADYN